MSSIHQLGVRDRNSEGSDPPGALSIRKLSSVQPSGRRSRRASSGRVGLVTAESVVGHIGKRSAPRSSRSTGAHGESAVDHVVVSRRCCAGSPRVWSKTGEHGGRKAVVRMSRAVISTTPSGRPGVTKVILSSCQDTQHGTHRPSKSLRVTSRTSVPPLPKSATTNMPPLRLWMVDTHRHEQDAPCVCPVAPADPLGGRRDPWNARRYTGARAPPPRGHSAPPAT